MDSPNNPNQTTTLVQVARLYYEENLSQQQLADKLGVSRSLVALYLKRAREQGIVRIEINDPQDTCEDLALDLQTHLSLRRVVVVPSSHNSLALTRRSIAGVLARHLESSLRDGDCLGIGFGQTMAELADLLVPTKSRDIDVVPLVGESSSGLIGSYSQVNQHVLKIAGAFSGRPHFLLAPLLVHSEPLHDLLMQDEVVSSVSSYWDRLTHVCVSIGTLPHAPDEVVYIGEENAGEFSEAGGVGDVCVRYFDAQGTFLDNPIYRRVVGISTTQMREPEHFIVAATGVAKARAVASFLQTHIATDLFIDEELAREVIAMQAVTPA